MVGGKLYIALAVIGVLLMSQLTGCAASGDNDIMDSSDGLTQNT
jgi:hypothetical protein